MHPVLKEGVSMGSFHYEGSDTTHYYIENADGEEFEISHSLWTALMQADGTRPLDLPDNGRSIIHELKKYGLIRTSRFVRGVGIWNRFILFTVGDRMQVGKLSKTINTILMAVSPLIFAIGIYLMASKGAVCDGNFCWWLFFSLIAVSFAFHESGHLIAGLACRYKISDVGIVLLGVIPFGLYVAHEDKKDATKAEQIQFALAGIEANLFIAGICLLLAIQYYRLSLTLLFVATMNVGLVAINLLPASGLDGESALSAACGIDSISEAAKRWLTNKKYRQKILRSGLPGYICIGIFFIALVANVFLWMLIGLDVIVILFSVF